MEPVGIVIFFIFFILVLSAIIGPKMQRSRKDR
jgi:hypothetical protein